MRVTIWDMDFYYKKTFFPNMDAMQLSSYHQQLGDTVNFVTEPFHIKLAFDRYYIIRTKKWTPRAPGSLMDDKRVRALGAQMRPYDNYYEIDEVVAAVRPDYLLYPEKERDPYYNASRIRFYHKNKLIKLRQSFENTSKHHKKTIVVDLNFWDSSNENIEYCLLELQNYKNIVFEAPIQLKKIIKNERLRSLFLKLNFSRGTLFRFRNDYGQELEDAKEIFKFIDEIKQSNPDTEIGKIPFKTVYLNHWEVGLGVENGIKDLRRCLTIIDYAKSRKINILMVKTDRAKFESPFWYYFDSLQYWTENLKEYSYIEYMTYSTTKKLGIQWYSVLNQPIKWTSPNVNFLLSLMVSEEFKNDLDNLIYRQWGDRFVDKTFINWKTIYTYQGKLKDTIKVEV